MINMEKGVDYKIEKLEKGPLQRFKNQNLLLKKFGETGLQIYKVITGKRSSEELRQDLDLDEDVFGSVLSYMEEAGMVKLTHVSEKKEAPPEEEKIKFETEEEPEKIEEEEIKFEKPEEEKEPEEEEIKFETEEEPEKIEEEEIKFEEQEEKPKKKRTKFEFEEIKPIGEQSEEAKEEEKEPEEEEPPVEEPEEEIKFEEPEGEDIEIEPSEELSPVEKIIKDKYGEKGIKVYNLVDGQRTAEQIMKEVGISESKLVEILDFMEDQGIIKLEYPKEKKAEKETEIEEKPLEEEKFAPIHDERAMPSVVTMEAGQEIGVPVKAPIDIVKSVQLRAKLLLKFGEKGTKIFKMIDGKNDLIDISLKLDISLYDLDLVFRYMLESGSILIKPLTRSDIKRKYGDDAYTVYKKYGRDGVTLYELIGRELTIKQMANLITKDKERVVEIFTFIHKILGIELPIDKEILKRQLGIS